MKMDAFFLMTDLFLVCELLPEHELLESNPGKRLSLCYPPLAARHLSVSSVDDTRIDVVVLKKEILELYLASRDLREILLREFENAVQAAVTRMWIHALLTRSRD